MSKQLTEEEHRAISKAQEALSPELAAARALRPAGRSAEARAAKKEALNRERADLYEEYAAGSLKRFDEIMKEVPENKVFNKKQQLAMAKLIQSGIFARCILRAHGEEMKIWGTVGDDYSRLVEIGEEHFGVTDMRDLDRRTLRHLRKACDEGEMARTEFVYRNLGLVTTFVEKTLRGKGISRTERDDMLAAGKVGLVMSVDAFDPALGYAFSTFAFFRIRQQVLEYIDTKTKLIKMPAHMDNLYKGIERAKGDFTSAGIRESDITVEMITKHIQDSGRDISLDQVRNAIKLRKVTTSMDVKLGDTDDSSSIVDMIADPENLEEEFIESQTVDDDFNALLSLVKDNRQREVLREWYSLPAHMTEEDVLSQFAEKHNLTPSRARQIKRDAEKELRSAIMQSDMRYKLRGSVAHRGHGKPKPRHMSM